jgi:hypothetical protein
MAAETDKRAIQKALVARILDGDGAASAALRRYAFDDAVNDGPLQGLLRKVALTPARITDEDIVSVKADGFTEDEIFELVVSAALGHATRQYESALAALSKAMARSKEDGSATRSS